MSTTAVTTGLSRTAYNDAVQAAENAKNLAQYKENLASTRTRLAAVNALVRATRQLHVDHIGTEGASHVAYALGEMSYTQRSLKQSVSDYERRIANLEGNTVVEDDDE